VGTLAISFLLALLAALVGWLSLVVLGLIRLVDDFDRRLTVVSMAMPGRIGRTGLKVGSVAPSFEAPSLVGGRVSSADWLGKEHLVLFAHPGCPPCETLVGTFGETINRWKFPPMIIVSEGEPGSHSEAWRQVCSSSGDVVVALQNRSSIARQFETFITPHLFVLAPDGTVRAQGVASTPEEMKAMLKTPRGGRGGSARAVGTRVNAP
jgi:peroxiredoxin